VVCGVAQFTKFPHQWSLERYKEMYVIKNYMTDEVVAYASCLEDAVALCQDDREDDIKLFYEKVK